MKSLFLLFLSITILHSCESSLSNTQNTEPDPIELPTEAKKTFYPPILYRDSIVHHLKAKVTNNQDLVVHVFVPLCDNENHL